MSSGAYIYNASTNLTGTVFPKTDAVPVPMGQDVNYVAAVDWNTLCNDLEDIRYALRTGQAYGLLSQASDPVPSGVTNYLWLRNDGQLLLKIGGVTTVLQQATLDETIASSTALSVTLRTSRLDAAGGNRADTLPNGLYVGQRKTITMPTAPGGNHADVTPTTFGEAGKTKVTLSGQWTHAELEWQAGGWRVISIGANTTVT